MRKKIMIFNTFVKTNSKLTEPNGFAKVVDILNLKIKKMIRFGLEF